MTTARDALSADLPAGAVNSTALCDELYRLARVQNGKDVDLTLNGVELTVLQDFDSARHVLARNSGNYEKNMPWFRQALGPSRMTENGPHWRFRQQLSQSALARFDRQRTFESCVAAAARCTQTLIAASAAGETRIADNVLRDMAARVMLETLFDRSLDEAGVDIAEIARMIAFGSDYAFSPATGRPSFAPGTLRDFLDVRARVLQDLQSFRQGPMAADSLLARLIAAEARSRDIEAPEAAGQGAKRQGPNSEANGQANEAGAGFFLEHELTLFFAAGAETTAASMGWAFYLLARHRELQEELRASADAFWSRHPRHWSDLEALAPINAFVGEVLRIFPPTPVVGRQAIAADRIGTRPIAAGRQILVSLVGVQHQRRSGTREDGTGEGLPDSGCAGPELADLWQPDLRRSAGPGPNAGHSFSFGVGPRVCAGARFALVELTSFVATFLRLAQFELTAHAPPQFRWQSQLLHEGGQPVRLIARHNAL